MPPRFAASSAEESSSPKDTEQPPKKQKKAEKTEKTEKKTKKSKEKKTKNTESTLAPLGAGKKDDDTDSEGGELEGLEQCLDLGDGVKKKPAANKTAPKKRPAAEKGGKKKDRPLSYDLSDLTNSFAVCF